MSGCRYQYCRELDRIRVVGHNGVGNAFVTVIVTPQGDPLLSGFVKLKRTEARLINLKIVNSTPLPHSEEMKKSKKKRLMYGQVHST